MEELEPFMHLIRFEKIDITRAENSKYLQLYRYDIPVLHFNGELLCMHRLNVELLRSKLNEHGKLNE